jgi:hypothetical protein
MAEGLGLTFNPGGDVAAMIAMKLSSNVHGRS